MGSRRDFTSLFKGTNDYEYTRLGAQVQNVQDKTVYVFGDGDVCEDDVVEFEMETIRSRRSRRSMNRQREKPLYVERQIAEGDTLHSLCLQYGCPVSSPINKSLHTLFFIWTFFLYAGSYRVLHRFL